MSVWFIIIFLFAAASLVCLVGAGLGNATERNGWWDWAMVWGSIALLLLIAALVPVLRR